MKPTSSSIHPLTTPRFVTQAADLTGILADMRLSEIIQLMAINEPLARDVKHSVDTWTDSAPGCAAALTFRGDIYSGLAAGQWSNHDATFAQQHLLILSGLYGVLRPFDAIKPYRLEMGYKLKIDDSTNLDAYWQQQLSGAFDLDDWYINLTANEYFKVIKKQLAKCQVISPKFLTVSPKTNQPVFVTVHAKIARGAFANWLIQNNIDDPAHITSYNELGYMYDPALSTETIPVFVCQEFGGLGRSVRLK